VTSTRSINQFHSSASARNFRSKCYTTHQSIENTLAMISSVAAHNNQRFEERLLFHAPCYQQIHLTTPPSLQPQHGIKWKPIQTDFVEILTRLKSTKPHCRRSSPIGRVSCAGKQHTGNVPSAQMSRYCIECQVSTPMTTFLVTSSTTTLFVLA